MERLPQGFVIDRSKMVHLEDVTSMECYAGADGSIARRALNGISFTVAAGERFAILGDERFDLMLLSEIIGNIKPYEAGRCSLVGLGMMREKQRILQHVYYVNERPRMYPHMQGISYLMFASGRARKNAVERQVMWLKRLKELGLERLCFTYVRNLSRAQRALLLILLALDIRAPLLLLDLSQIDVPPELYDAFARLFALLTEEMGKTIVFATADAALSDRCATAAALLLDGKVRKGQWGPLGALYDALDHRLYTLETQSDAEACALLSSAFPALRAELTGGGIFLYGDKAGAPEPSALLAALEDAGIAVRDFARSAPTLDEARKEARRLAV